MVSPLDYLFSDRGGCSQGNTDRIKLRPKSEVEKGRSSSIKKSNDNRLGKRGGLARSRKPGRPRKKKSPYLGGESREKEVRRSRHKGVVSACSQGDGGAMVMLAAQARGRGGPRGKRKKKEIGFGGTEAEYQQGKFYRGKTNVEHFGQGMKETQSSK